MEMYKTISTSNGLYIPIVIDKGTFDQVFNVYGPETDILELIYVIGRKYHFLDSAKEKTYVIFLRNEDFIGAMDITSSSSEKDCGIDLRDLARLLTIYHADSCYLFHNHPNDVLEPSDADIESYFAMKEFLGKIDVELIDDCVVTCDGIYYIKESKTELFYDDYKNDIYFERSSFENKIER